MQRLDRRNKILNHGRNHFWFDMDGVRYGYCYIRKNACSAFKKMICKTSEEADFSSHSGNELQFMEAYHRIRNFDQLRKCDRMIFVRRDPYERLVSTFVNKFIVQTGNDAIFKSYKTHTGKNPKTATFRDFVSLYCKEFRQRDGHVYPQHLHLLPIRYDAVLDINALHQDVTELMGSDVAERFFAKKANSSSYGADTKPESDTPCNVLHDVYRETSSLPSRYAFDDGDIVQVVMQRYEKDYDMILALKS